MDATYHPIKMAITKLSGKALLEKIREMSDLGDSDIKECAKATGYITFTGRAQVKEYLMALAQANGLHQESPEIKKSLPARESKIGASNSVTIGKKYLESINASPGDLLKISIKRGKIVIEKIKKDVDETAEQPQLIAV